MVGDIGGLKAGEAKLSLIMNEAGGIVDDTVITNSGDHMYLRTHTQLIRLNAVNVAIWSSTVHASIRIWSTFASMPEISRTFIWTTRNLCNLWRCRFVTQLEFR